MAYIDTKTFIEVFPTSTDFVSNFTGSAFTSYVSDEKYLNMIYELLLAKYENSRIADISTDSFKRKINSTIFMYAPAWIKRLEVQQTLISLTEKEITAGAVAKSTRGYNPSDVPGTANSDTEIETVNEQSLQKYTKSKLDGYNNLLELLRTDVTNDFISKFKKLFMATIDIDDIMIMLEDEQ